MAYGLRGLPTSSGVYLDDALEQPVLAAASYDAYGTPERMQLRSATPESAIVQSFVYDNRHRPYLVRTERGAASGVAGAPGTLNAITVPFQELYDWDRASNLVGITSLASAPGAFPEGRRQQRRSVDHDSLGRVANVFTDYQQDDLTWAPSDTNLFDYRDERTRTNGDGSTHEAADPMHSTPAPAAVPPAPMRGIDLTYEYDWLANMTTWDDDARSFHERSIGSIGNGADGTAADALRPSALYLSSNLRTSSSEPLTANEGWLDVDYGEGGNAVAVTVRAQCADRAPGACFDDPTATPSAREARLRAGCVCANEQHYQYRWDELNRLAEARRYDRAGTGDWTLKARQRYRYDGGNGRVVKQSLDVTAASTQPERTHLYVFPGDFERTGVHVDTQNGSNAYIGDPDLGTETEYHVAGTTLVRKPSSSANPFDPKHRITMPIGDLLGTASAVVDLQSGHLLELATFQPSGAREMHWMTNEASVTRERNAFTGKEEDEEVGVTYFGQRYLIQRVARWASPDPVALHNVRNALLGNTFSYVDGKALASIDRIGLYGEESHYYLVHVAVLAAGGTADDANRIAYFSQLPDEVVQFDATALSRGLASIPRTNPDRPAAEDVVTAYEAGLHALDGGDAQTSVEVGSEMAAEATRTWQIGASAHYVLDALAHTTEESRETYHRTGSFRDLEHHGPFVGHLFEGHEPDEPRSSHELFGEAAGLIYDIMRARNPDATPRMTRDDFVQFAMTTSRSAADHDALADRLRAASAAWGAVPDFAPRAHDPAPLSEVRRRDGYCADGCPTVREMRDYATETMRRANARRAEESSDKP